MRGMLEEFQSNVRQACGTETDVIQDYEESGMHLLTSAGGKYLDA